MRPLKLSASGAVCAAALLFGCAHEPAARPTSPVTPVTTTTSRSAPAKPGIVTVSAELLKACNIHLDNVDQAPKFAFDESVLRGDDRAVLQQIATCVTTGPLKGRHLQLVGRADPRGETEYNLVLGEHRASSVDEYLMQLGVASGQLAVTSRGEMDATGHDEAGWQRDRRVDVDLR